MRTITKSNPEQDFSSFFLLKRRKYADVLVVMDVTMALAIFKPEKNLVFFQDKIAGAIDDYPGRLE